MTRGERSFLVGILVLHAQPLIGIERGEVVEVDLVAGLFGVFEVDGVDLEKGEIAFALLRASDLALDGVAGAQAEAADLRGRDVDVVGSGQVIRLGSAQKAEAVLENFDNAFADNVDFVLGKLLENREHQLLLAHGRGILDAVFFGKTEQFGGGFGLEVLEFHFPHAGDPGGTTDENTPIKKMEGKGPQVVGEARR